MASPARQIRLRRRQSGFSGSLLFEQYLFGKIGAQFSGSCFNISNLRPKALFRLAAYG
jgi:hypothetical protein